MFRHITLNVYPLMPTAQSHIYPRTRTSTLSWYTSWYKIEYEVYHDFDKF